MPSSRALRRPSESGSMPTIHTGSSTALRCSFASRSVPMLPGPMRAHLTFFMGAPESLDEANRTATDAADAHAQAVAGLDRHHRRERAGQDDFAGLERHAQRA